MIVPSILTANNMHLATDIKESINCGITRFHIDIMDGHFVPNLSYGPELIKDLKHEFPNIQIEIHLMSNNLEQMIPLFVKTGCDLLEFHIEVSKDNTSKWIKLLKQSHIKSGIVLKPSTPVSTIAPYLNSIDQLLLMTVTPGFGGQKFQSDSSDRIKQAKTLIIQHNTYIPIEVDGGINNETVRIAKNAGADIFVAGSYIYNQKSISNQIRELKSVIE